MNCSLCKYRSNLLGFEGEVGSAQISHHHHVEGIKGNCSVCGTENLCICNIKEDQSVHDHAHSPHPIYPNSEHPLGPITLQS